MRCEYRCRQVVSPRPEITYNTHLSISSMMAPSSSAAHAPPLPPDLGVVGSSLDDPEAGGGVAGEEESRLCFLVRGDIVVAWIKVVAVCLGEGEASERLEGKAESHLARPLNVMDSSTPKR